MSLSREQIYEIINRLQADKLSVDEAERYLWDSVYPDELPKPTTMTVVAYIAVNETADVEASDQRDNALDRLAESHGGICAQVVKITLTLPVQRTHEAAITVDAAKVETVKIEAA
jgi:hypothetical protein